MTSFFSQQVGLIMWIAIGNTIVSCAYIYVFFWVPQVPPQMVEQAREEMAIELAGDLKNLP